MCAKGLTEEDVVAYVGGICFKTGPPGLIGAESEWLVTDPQRPHEHVPLPDIQAAVSAAHPLPAHSEVSYEPGGQLELSSLPHHGVSPCHDAMHADLAHLERRLAEFGLRLSGWGLDPLRGPRRQLHHPRYSAMEGFFDARGRAGRVMMCSTAAVQVCVDIGATAAEATRRWRLAHALGPVLVASFANSPLSGGRPTGWRSTRQAVWAAVDERRTAPPAGTEPVEAWSGYALDAPVMVIRREEQPWLADPGLTFREWVRDGGRGRDFGGPTEDDFAYHLSTLFPPVRPRGCLELRMVDAQPKRYWPVPLGVLAAVFDDPAAAEAAMEACESVAGCWTRAARDGAADPALTRAARACFGAALEALPRLKASGPLRDLVAEFADRYVDRGRCPADDVLDDPQAAFESEHAVSMQ